MTGPEFNPNPKSSETASPETSRLMASDMVFRECTLEDLNPVVAFLNPFVESQHLLARTLEEYRVLLRHGFLALNQTEIIGFAAVEIYSRKLAEIQALAVAPTQQRQGIGRRLIQMCVERAKRENVVELMAITASEKLFSEVGFQYTLPDLKRALFVKP